jgi:hypothetical protein
VDDRDAISIIDDTDFQRLNIRGRPNEHRDVGIIGLESSPVVSECMEHVVIGDAVFTGARLDVHLFMLRISSTVVNIC